MKQKILLVLVFGIILFTGGLLIHISFGQSSPPSASVAPAGGDSAAGSAKAGNGKSSGGVFGGTISNTKAEEIESLENSNYKCTIAGETIEVRPVNKAPYSYMIPSGIKNRTGFSLRDGQWIIGKYRGKTTITCIFQGDPPTEKTVTLDKVTLYGTSKE